MYIRIYSSNIPGPALVICTQWRSVSYQLMGQPKHPPGQGKILPALTHGPMLRFFCPSTHFTTVRILRPRQPPMWHYATVSTYHPSLSFLLKKKWCHARILTINSRINSLFTERKWRIVETSSPEGLRWWCFSVRTAEVINLEASVIDWVVPVWIVHLASGFPQHLKEIWLICVFFEFFNVRIVYVYGGKFLH